MLNGEILIPLCVIVTWLTFWQNIAIHPFGANNYHPVSKNFNNNKFTWTKEDITMKEDLR